MQSSRDTQATSDSSKDTLVGSVQSRFAMRFFRAGGFNQICLETAEDLKQIKELDHTLWVASSCPTQGLNMDERSLELMDFDEDGRIRCGEVITAIDWIFQVMADPSTLPEGKDSIRLEQLNQEDAQGAQLLEAAQRILRNLGKADEPVITLADTLNRSGILSVVKSNGDGVISPGAASDENTRALIEDIIRILGGEQDVSGEMGVTEEQVETFFKACQAFLSWWQQGHRAEGDETLLDEAVFPLSDKTVAAYGAYVALRSKIEDYFAQAKVAAFDGSAVSFFNFNQDDLKGLESRGREDIRTMLEKLPLAELSTSQDLQLARQVNPLYAERLLQFQEHTVLPILGKAKSYITQEDWQRIETTLAPYEAWLTAKPTSGVDALGVERLLEITQADERQELLRLIAEDKGLAQQIQSIQDVEKLIRFHRDLFRLLNNYVALPDFYDVNRQAIFQHGTLILDGCALRLVVLVDDLKQHMAIAGKSGIFLAYCEIKRKDQPKPQIIAAAVTNRNIGRIIVGKHGVFYDLKGLDWDARVTHIVSNPISLSEATWAPFRRIGELFGSQLEKLTASRQKALESNMDKTFKGIDKSVGAGPTDSAPTSAPQNDKGISSGAGLGGLLAGGGVALAALSSSFAYVTETLKGVGPKDILYTLVVILMFIFLPTIILGIIKLRKRDLGYILEACGWAINGKMRIDLLLARQLTHVGTFPLGAQRIPFIMMNPGGQKTSRLFWWCLGIGSVLVLFSAGVLIWG